MLLSGPPTKNLLFLVRREGLLVQSERIDTLLRPLPTVHKVVRVVIFVAYCLSSRSTLEELVLVKARVALRIPIVLGPR